MVVRNSDLVAFRSKLQLVAEALGSKDILGLRFEFWVRWNVDNDARILRQWVDTNVSELYRSVDQTTVADVKIEADPSKVDVGKVFCYGRQFANEDVDGDSWVASVVTYRDPVSRLPIPVGVIVIRGPKAHWQRKFGSGQGSLAIGNAFEILDAQALRMLS